MRAKNYTLVDPAQLGAIAVWKAEDGSSICFFACQRAKGWNRISAINRPAREPLADDGPGIHQ